MIEMLRTWVLNIVTLTVFIILIEILIPSGKLKKYVNLVTGVVLIIAIVKPLVGFLGGNIDLNLKSFELTGSNFIDKREIEAQSKVLKDNQMKQIAEVYRRKVIKQIEENTGNIQGIAQVKGDVIINEDYASQNFGEIRRIYLTVKPGSGDGDVKPVVKVRKVDIDGENKPTQGAVDTKLKKQLEDRVSKLLGVNKENIVVSFEE